MAEDTLRVLAQEGILVLDIGFAMSSGGKRRYVGRSLTIADEADQLPKDGDCIVREVDPVVETDKHYFEGWVRNTEPTTVPAKGEFGTYYRSRVKEGSLVAADEATAIACGVPFVTAAPTQKKTAKKDGE